MPEILSLLWGSEMNTSFSATGEQFRAQIRFANFQDIGSISEYLDRYKDRELFFYSKKTIRRMVCGDNEGRKPYSITLAFDGEKIIGIAIVSSKSKTLSLLFVSPEYRGNCIGAQLFTAANPRQILMKRSAIGYFHKIVDPAGEGKVLS